MDRHTLRARLETAWERVPPLPENLGGWALMAIAFVVFGAMVALCEGV